MKKDENKIVWVTTVVCLSPMLLSAILYNKLPAQLPIHFDAAGNPDNYAPKLFAAFGLPILMAALHLFLHLVVQADPKRNNGAAAIRGMTYFILPIMSLIFMPMTLFKGMGYDVPIHVITPVLVGLLFIFIGNYLPKCKQNYTMGIKLPWTLADEDNWNKTHRMAGFLWVIGGMVMILSGFLQRFAFPVTMVVVAVMVFVPFGYSYQLYRKRS